MLEQGRARPTTQLSGGAIRAAAGEAWREGAANGLGAAHEDQRAASRRRHRSGPLYPRAGASVKQSDRWAHILHAMFQSTADCDEASTYCT